jgi:hypothetical protein
MFVIVEEKATKKFVDIWAVDDDLDIEALNTALRPLQVQAAFTEVSVADVDKIVASAEASISEKT